MMTILALKINPFMLKGQPHYNKKNDTNMKRGQPRKKVQEAS
jgi:hypothetical protein